MVSAFFWKSLFPLEHSTWTFRIGAGRQRSRTLIALTDVRQTSSRKFNRIKEYPYSTKTFTHTQISGAFSTLPLDTSNKICLFQESTLKRIYNEFCTCSTRKWFNRHVNKLSAWDFHLIKPEIPVSHQHFGPSLTQAQLLFWENNMMNREFSGRTVGQWKLILSWPMKYTSMCARAQTHTHISIFICNNQNRKGSCQNCSLSSQIPNPNNTDTLKMESLLLFPSLRWCWDN